jgi:hypothetical protein
MRAVSEPGQRTVSGPGRWVWALAGLITAVALVIPGTRLIDTAWLWWRVEPPGNSVSVHATPTAASGQPGSGSSTVSAHPTPTSAP